MNAQETAELRETIHRLRFERDEARERVTVLEDAIKAARDPKISDNTADLILRDALAGVVR